MLDLNSDSIIVIHCNPLDILHVRKYIEEAISSPVYWSVYGGFSNHPERFLDPLEAATEPLERACLKPDNYIWENFFSVVHALDPFNLQYVTDLFLQLFHQGDSRIIIVQTDDTPVPSILQRLVVESDFPLPHSAEIERYLADFRLPLELKTRCSGLSKEELKRGLQLAAKSSDPQETLESYRKHKLSYTGSISNRSLLLKRLGAWTGLLKPLMRWRLPFPTKPENWDCLILGGGCWRVLQVLARPTPLE